MPTLASAKPIGDLLGANARPLRVPRLQRPYSWTNREIDDLWGDLVEFESEHPGDALTGQEYFLGGIVGYSKAVAGRNIVEVLDGQQRLASLTILLASLRDRLYEDGHEPLSRELQNANIVQFAGLGAEGEPLLRLNRTDGDFIEAHIQRGPWVEGGALPTTQTPSQGLILKAQQRLRAHIESYVNGGGAGTVDSIRRIHRVVVESCVVVLVTSEDWNDVADVFERLNDRGKGLSTLDLLRNYLINAAPVNRQRRVEDDWNDVFELSDSASKVDAFLRHVWISHRGDVKARALFKEIKATMENPNSPDLLKDPVQFSANLAADAGLYRNLLAGEHPDPEGARHLRAIQQLAATSLYPPALSALRAGMPEDEFVLLLRSLVSTFVRHNLTLSGESTDLEAASYAAAKAITDGGDLAEAQTHLRPLLGEDDAMQQAFEVLSITRSGYQRHILEELERYLTLIAQHGDAPPDAQQEAEIGPADSNVLWIEHIYPQSPDNTWGRWQNHDDLINRLGNLTLIHKKLNATMKNAIFDDKKPEYEQSQLRLNVPVQAMNAWTVQDIRERQADLAKYAPKIWARF